MYTDSRVQCVRATVLTHFVALVTMLAMPTVSHTEIFGVGEVLHELFENPTLSHGLALWNVDLALPLLAGLGFAVAVCHYNRRDLYQSYVLLGFGALTALGAVLTLSSYAQPAIHHGSGKAALSMFVHYVLNVLLPVFGFTECGGLLLRKSGADETPHIVWLWKILGGVMVLSLLLRFDISMQARGLM